MVWWDYNSNRSQRKVQCPECGHESISRRQYTLCSIEGCRHRFDGDDHEYKTDEDWLNIRQEIYRTIKESESKIQTELGKIRAIKQKLKPLHKPKYKLKSSKTEPAKQAVA